ncbi:site-specific integrase [Acidithiobacillus sp. M4-SHS-6]|uniref:site-specific integrase n=1 Tax=Acidithiobacillus sp. M4-SHS-6 TaxID=3383024 RepID=UPI0039BDC36B
MTMTFDTKLEAQRWAVEKETEIGRSSPEQVRQRIENRQYTLNEALNRYEQEVLPGKSNNAQTKEPSTIKNLRDSLGGIPLTEITGAVLSQTIRDWNNSKRWSANTVRIHLSLLSFLYNVARKEWDMPELINPASLVRRPRLPKGRDRRLVDDEESRLLRECALTNPELADIARFAIETAMRQGEIISMTWDNVHLDRHTVFLPRTKDPRLVSESRTVPLSEVAEMCLVRQRERLRSPSPSSAVWTYTQEGLRSSYNKARIRAGIVGMTFHDLRHEAISRLGDEEVPVMTIQAITGHKSMQMLKRYMHVSTRTLVRTMRK